MSVVTVGDNCIDYYLSSKQAFPGGNALNVAVYLRRFSVDCSFISVIGDDAYGEMILSALKSYGINYDFVYKAEGATALSRVTLVNGDRVFGKYDEGVMKDFKLSDAALRFIASHRFMHTAFWGRTESYLPSIQQSGVKIFYDFADCSDAARLNMVLPHIDFALFSAETDNAETRLFLKEVMDSGLTFAVATLGAEGSLGFDGKSFVKLPAPQIEVVDTMGAGDSFAAGVLAGLEKDLDLKGCMELGTKSSAITLSYRGAWPF